MIDLKQFELWFVTGSQTLYGEETLKKVADNARAVAAGLDAAAEIPVRVVYQPPVTDPQAVARVCREANARPECLGLITWMHTFSPAKMWIAGLRELAKPFVHLHTQFNRDLPWDAIDMDFMNLNQSAHGDREFGYLCSRMGLRRAVVVGHWQDADVRRRLGAWSRAAIGRYELRRVRIARFGDNMREVAVTEGDKVEAQITLGCSVLGYGVGDLVAAVQQVSDAEIDRLTAEYDEQYATAPELRPGGARRGELREAARIELGLRAFLQDGGFHGLTDTFENLHGLRQLPGLAVQRLMADGYGFGAEGDWKTAALVRAMKVMAAGLPGGTSFMEDYTYHLAPGEEMVLGAHMLEVCPSIAADRPSLEIHPLSIGGKEDPVRLVFDARPGPAVNAALMDFGDRFRLLVNAVETIPPPAKLPRLPVARAVWKPLPDFKTAAACWIWAGGAHHTAFSHGVTPDMLEDLAEMLGLEFFFIGPETSQLEFRREARAANDRRR
ncbi:L-arabinose isomerase [Thermopirellula anaerolimosa]